MKKMNSTYFWNRVTLELLPKQNSNFYWNDKFYIFFFFEKGKFYINKS